METTAACSGCSGHDTAACRAPRKGRSRLVDQRRLHGLSAVRAAENSPDCCLPQGTPERLRLVPEADRRRWAARRAAWCADRPWRRSSSLQPPYGHQRDLGVPVPPEPRLVGSAVRTVLVLVDLLIRDRQVRATLERPHGGPGAAIADLPEEDQSLVWYPSLVVRSGRRYAPARHTPAPTCLASPVHLHVCTRMPGRFLTGTARHPRTGPAERQHPLVGRIDRLSARARLGVDMYTRR